MEQESVDLNCSSEGGILACCKSVILMTSMYRPPGSTACTDDRSMQVSWRVGGGGGVVMNEQAPATGFSLSCDEPATSAAAWAVDPAAAAEVLGPVRSESAAAPCAGAALMLSIRVSTILTAVCRGKQHAVREDSLRIWSQARQQSSDKVYKLQMCTAACCLSTTLRQLWPACVR